MALPRSCPWGPRNRKLARAATFLRLGIATDPSNRRLDRKSAGGLLQSGYFSLCRGGGEPLIAKKLQKRSDFCFCGRWIAAAGQIPQRVDRRSGGGSRKGRVAAAGQIIQRAGSARSGVSVRTHFATRFACDDDTVCITECAPFWLVPTLWS